MECKSLDPPAMLIISRRGTTTRHYNFVVLDLHLPRSRSFPSKHTPFSDKLSLSLSLVPARVVDNFTFLESSRGNEEARLIASLFLRREQLTSIRPPSGPLYLISILLAHGLRIFRSNRTRHLPTKFSLAYFSLFTHLATPYPTDELYDVRHYVHRSFPIVRCSFIIHRLRIN